MEDSCKGTYYVGNPAKRQISKRALEENKARKVFRKTNISFFLIRTRALFLVTLTWRFTFFPY